MKSVLSTLKDDRGSAESALVTIPLLLVFLFGMQILVSAHFRNIEKIALQDSVTKRAISGQLSESDSFIHVDSSGDSQNLDLLVARSESPLPILVPGLKEILGFEPMVNIDGIAIIENQR